MKKVSMPCLGVVLAVFTTLAGFALPTPVAAAADNSIIHIKNKSDWEIHHLFMSPVDQDHWGLDQLGREVIEVGGSFELHKVPCNSYDVKLIDEDGDECVIPHVDLCASKEAWVITNDALLGCENDGD